jgi:hypothetical protein
MNVEQPFTNLGISFKGVARALLSNYLKRMIKETTTLPQ